jgi:hypothetical protein
MIKAEQPMIEIKVRRKIYEQFGQLASLVPIEPEQSYISCNRIHDPSAPEDSGYADVHRIWNIDQVHPQ